MWSCLSLRRNARELAPAAPRRARPCVEALESREVLSAAPVAGAAFGPALFAPAAQPQAAPIVPLSITNVIIQDGQLLAQGLLGSHAFTVPVTLGPNAASTAATPILNLHLG